MKRSLPTGTRRSAPMPSHSIQETSAYSAIHSSKPHTLPKLFHDLFEYKILIMEITPSGRSGWVPVRLIEEFHNLETAFVYIEMYVAFLKIRRDQTPDLGIRISLLQTLPDPKSKSTSVFVRIHIKQLQPTDTCLRINLDNDSSYLLSVSIYRQRFTLRVV